MTEINGRPCALYRFFNSSGELLYVGIALDIGKRWPKHADGKPWWHEVARTTVEHFTTRTEAIVAEKNAIATEKPKYNVRHNNGTATGTVSSHTSAASADGPSSGVVRDGDVVAIALWSGECPVGIVTDVDDMGLRIELMSFLDGEFSRGPRVVFWSAVAEIVHAREQNDWERPGRNGMTVGELKGLFGGSKVFDTKPLGEFQTRWEAAHLPREKCERCNKHEYVTRTVGVLDWEQPDGEWRRVCRSCEQRLEYEEERQIEERRREAAIRHARTETKV